ncbi:hypothetical protein OVV29_35570, partial [Klebsiella pneumoniae]|nr:hypothetical protein [Klebsiella pneumoniae]
VVTGANGQPAVAGYVRRARDAAYRPLALGVLTVCDGAVTEIVTFDGTLFGLFDLPAELAAAAEPLDAQLASRPGGCQGPQQGAGGKRQDQ